jgi:hypothetical protein
MRVAVAINHRLNAVQIGNHQSGTCCLKDGKYKGRTVQGKIFPGTHRHRIQSTLCYTKIHGGTKPQESRPSLFRTVNIYLTIRNLQRNIMFVCLAI